MCGIAGVYAFGGRPDRDVVERMTAAIGHRGPDGSGHAFSGPAGLGHRRLSIIDLDGGSQPMSTADGRFTITYNGELYNFVDLRDELVARGHTFRTRSDTEVVLQAYQAWGLECLQHLNGMFSFAVYDSELERLVLARDPLGIKPLYYHVSRDRLAFASEIKSILTDADVPRRVDQTALSWYLGLRYVPSPRTMLKDVFKLPPGHCLTIENDDWTVSRYWVRPPTVWEGIDEREAEDEYDRLLGDAIHRQLASDVPVGIFLSGGTDSSLLLARMREYYGDPIQAFTVSFPGQSQEDESAVAAETARHFGAEHHKVEVGAKDHLDLLGVVSHHLEEPITTTSIVPYFALSECASKDLKVVLTGQGADEPWAGYTRYLSERYAPAIRVIPRPVRNLLSSLAEVWPGRGETVRRGLRSLARDEEIDRFLSVYALFTEDERTRLLPTQSSSPGEVFSPYLEDVSHLDSLSRMMYLDTRVWLPDDLLLYGDKLAMAHGLEARVPFLDLDLLAFVERLPIEAKLKGLTGKYLHKRVADRYLPREVTRRPKQGFASPIDGWLQHELNKEVYDVLLGTHSSIPKYLDRREVARLIAEHGSGKRNRQRQLFSLIAFEMWHRVFIDQGN